MTDRPDLEQTIKRAQDRHRYAEQIDASLDADPRDIIGVRAVSGEVSAWTRPRWIPRAPWRLLKAIISLTRLSL